MRRAAPSIALMAARAAARERFFAAQGDREAAARYREEADAARAYGEHAKAEEYRALAAEADRVAREKLHAIR